MRSIPQNYFVYTLTNSLTGKVFYVGKGHSIKRMNAHEREARQGVDSHKCRVIRKIWTNGGTVIRSKVATFPNDTDALIYEWVLINLIYGIENLTNHAEGGIGPKGYVRTPEQNEANRQRGIARMADPERREYIRKVNQGKKMTPEQIENWRQSIQDVYTPKKREKCSQEKKEWWQSEEGLQLQEQYILRAQDPINRAKCGAHNIGNTYNAKTYIGFVSPDGEIYQNIHNLKLFSKEHGLLASKMSSVSTGRRLHHRGWTRYNP